MSVLVADIGGTNSRLALASERGLDPTSIQRFKNADHASLYDVIALYLRQKNATKVGSCCVAMAGPVTGQHARLTNFDWEISTTGLKECTGTDAAWLINDLTALGYSIGHIPADGLSMIRPGTEDKFRNGQSLVIGLGTGFNVCPTKRDDKGNSHCLEIELGHANIPQSVANALEIALKGGAADFQTVEDCFCGRGLAHVFAILSQTDALSGDKIVANHLAGTDPIATRALELFAKCLGILSCELVLQYLPLNGIFFAGSVARGVFDAGMTPQFLAALSDNKRFENQFAHVPVHLILDDAAALIGCVEAAKTL